MNMPRMQRIMPTPKRMPKIMANRELPGIVFSTITLSVDDTTITYAGGAFLGGGMTHTSVPLASHLS
jgi:hypothetical protein